MGPWRALPVKYIILHYICFNWHSNVKWLQEDVSTSAWVTEWNNSFGFTSWLVKCFTENTQGSAGVFSNFTFIERAAVFQPICLTQVPCRPHTLFTIQAVLTDFWELPCFWFVMHNWNTISHCLSSPYACYEGAGIPDRCLKSCVLFLLNYSKNVFDILAITVVHSVSATEILPHYFV